MIDLPPDAWCDKYYQGGEYLKTADAVWGIRSSVYSAIAIRHVVALRAGEPYLTLWPYHWRLLMAELPRIGVNAIEFTSSEALRQEIWLLATRNRYPANSLIHIVIWQEQKSCGKALRHALFQSRMSRALFDCDPRKALRLAPPSEYGIVGGNAGAWSETSIEALAQRSAEEAGLDGACLQLANGRIARVTVGNIFFLLQGGRVVGSSLGTRPDALCDYVREKGLWERLRLKYEEMEGIPQSVIYEALECFVCDAVLGLQPVLSVGTDKRFMRISSIKFAEELRRMTSL